VSFFEPPPRPEPRDLPEIPKPKPWWEAPTNELGAGVPVRVVLARTDRVAVALTGATAYTTGVQLRLSVRRRHDPGARPEALDDPMDFPFGHPSMRHGPQVGDLPPDLLRFGVQFSDGGKATTLGGSFPWSASGDAEQEPAGPVLNQGGGGGGGGNWDWDFWLWPVPPPGQVTFAVEWPKEGIELSKREVDAGPFIEASRSSEVLWPDAGGGGGSYTTGQIVLRAHKSDEEPPSG
jgi:hypothetical protein